MFSDFYKAKIRIRAIIDYHEWKTIVTFYLTDTNLESQCQKIFDIEKFLSNYWYYHKNNENEFSQIQANLVPLLKWSNKNSKNGIDADCF